MTKQEFAKTIETYYAVTKYPDITVVTYNDGQKFYGYFQGFEDEEALKREFKFRFVPMNNIQALRSDEGKTGKLNPKHSIVIECDKILNLELVPVNTLKNTLILKNQEAHDPQRTKRKEQWVSSIDRLYDKIVVWLTPLKNDGLLEIKLTPIDITEEYLGLYSAKKMDILIGDDVISIKPRGTYILGAYGRLDMRGPKGETYIIEQEWDSWKFAKRTPNLQTWELTDESFNTEMQNLING